MSKIFPHTSDLEAVAWPGGYTILYLLEDPSPYSFPYKGDSVILCAGCASAERRRAVAKCEHRNQTFTPFVHWEGPPEFCEGCNKDLPSEYGDPDSEES